MQILLSITLLLGANAFESTWTQANAAYEARDYAAAANAYEQLVASGVADAAVFYNLGNAYYRDGRLGPAIVNYERALSLEPGLEAARENLAQAVRQTERRLARPVAAGWRQSLLFWDTALPPRTVLSLAGAAWMLVWGLLALRLWRPLRFLRLAACVIALFAALFAVSAWAKHHPPQLAVAIDDRVPVRFGTNESESVRFELYEGDRVLVDERSGSWMRVTTVSGERGWADASGLLLAGPPYLPFEATDPPRDP